MPEKSTNPKLPPNQVIQAPITSSFEVMITTLPNGRDDSFLKLSVVLFPQLKTSRDATLALFNPLFTTDWPEFVRNLTFDVFFNSGSDIVQQRAKGEWEFVAPPQNTPPFDQALWARIFKENLLVRGYNFDPMHYTDATKFTINTFQEKLLVKSLKGDLYQPTALEGIDRLPSKATIVDRLKRMEMIEPGPPRQGDLQVGTTNPALELKRIQNLLKKFGPNPEGFKPGQTIKPGSPTAPQSGPKASSAGTRDRAFGRHLAIPRISEQKLREETKLSFKQLNLRQFQAFHYVSGKSKDQPSPPRPDPPQYDFHQLVASLFEYPGLARVLGLCVDLRIKLDSRIPESGHLWVRPDTADPKLAAKFISPKTVYRLGGLTGFMSQPEFPDLQLQDGMLTFGSKIGSMPAYDVVPGDVDAMVLTVQEYSTKMVDKLNPKIGKLNQTIIPNGLSRSHSGDSPSSTIKADAEKEERKELDDFLAEDTTLPALRSAGLAVAHNTRDHFLDYLLEQSNSNNTKLTQSAQESNGTNIILTADDLIRGLRIDVREIQNGGSKTPLFTPWRSLNYRRGSYHLLGDKNATPGSPLSSPFLAYDDEGWVSLGLTQEEDPPADDPDFKKILAQPKLLQVYQSMFRWDGWSLSVPRPGKHLGLDDEPVRGQGETLSGFSPLQVLFTPVPNTLPRLRFGRQYQFRARVVDLAGNSLSVDVPAPSQDFVTAMNDGFYDRMEPVPSPTILLTAPLVGHPNRTWPKGEPLSPGESVDRLVIRTMNLEYPDQALEGLPAGPPSTPSARHLAPPRISQELAEQHGMFDDHKTRLMRGTDAYQMMIAKEGSFSDLIPPERRAMIKKPGEEFFPEPSVTVPYLPDPMAVGVSLVVFPPGKDPKEFPVLQVPFPVQDGWPHVESVKIQLEPGDAQPTLSQNLLKVFVPPGEQRILRASCYLVAEKDPQFSKPNRETLLGIWRWLEEQASDKNREEFRRVVQQGRHWMLTPFHEMVLIHATQQPVLTPLWQCISALSDGLYGRPKAPGCYEHSPEADRLRARSVGDTAATIDGTIFIHRASTEELDIHAEWLDPIDDPATPMTSEDLDEWLYVKASASPFNVKVSYVRRPSMLPVLAQDLPNGGRDLKERTTLETSDSTGIQSDAYELIADSESEPGMLPQQPLKPYKFAFQVNSQGTPVYDESQHRCAPAPPPAPPKNHGQGLHFHGLHRFNDTKYRCVSYTAIATSRYREYFRPLPDEEVELLAKRKITPRWTRTSPPIKLDILSTTQPDAPKIVYVIPTFKWDNAPHIHHRGGGGLRIYLDRPWFSSGDGEQLAVVLYPSGGTLLPDYAKNQVTQWGLDPLWEMGLSAGRSGNPKPLGDFEIGMTHPTVSHFRNYVAVRHDLAVNEVRLPTELIGPAGMKMGKPMPVTICTFDVKPDISRQLWYCDIEINPGKAYFPFVRLALARYQANSIPWYHLSPVVLTDFAQLLPDRTATALVDPTNTNEVIVTVKGVRGIAGRIRHTEVEVQLEEFSPADTDELDGWTPVPKSKPVLLPRGKDLSNWRGRLSLPRSDRKRLRVVVKEFEVFQVVEEADTRHPEERRLVYADTLAIQR